MVIRFTVRVFREILSIWAVSLLVLRAGCGIWLHALSHGHCLSFYFGTNAKKKRRILYFKLGSVIRDNTGMLTNHFNSVYMHCE